MTWAFHFAVVARYLALFRDQRAYGIPAFLDIFESWGFRLSLAVAIHHCLSRVVLLF